LVAVARKFLDHPKPEDRFFGCVVEDVQSDQA